VRGGGGLRKIWSGVMEQDMKSGGNFKTVETRRITVGSGRGRGQANCCVCRGGL
jgi:hypothetical protein